MHVSLLSNPSHLEAVDPVVEGIVRAKQAYRGDAERRQVMPLLIHGDAAFTGQGIVTETLSLSELDAYRTGGTIHVIVNNQVGFTTPPRGLPLHALRERRRQDHPGAGLPRQRRRPRSRRAGGATGRGLPHASSRVDVIIDLVCYRRHGHNETDDPTFTQPVMYKIIDAAADRARALRRAAGRHRRDDRATEIDRRIAEWRELFEDALNYARDFMPRQQVFALGGVWKG